MLEKIKLALRIKNSAYDAEIQDLIDACKIDLATGGVKVVDELNSLTQHAIVLYCKANFGYDENSQKFAEAYEKLKIVLALTGDLNV